ncbi:uncharacterized protein LOC142361472 [Opisthocomus hoazin]|uniref:uncharacterized protein LOC142361472 n=1 Tax=Opisthocomus hoazin TaxID=30419 RepID=UPI003F52E121
MELGGGLRGAAGLGSGGAQRGAAAGGSAVPQRYAEAAAAFEELLRLDGAGEAAAQLEGVRALLRQSHPHGQSSPGGVPASPSQAEEPPLPPSGERARGSCRQRDPPRLRARRQPPEPGAGPGQRPPDAAPQPPRQGLLPALGGQRRRRGRREGSAPLLRPVWGDPLRPDAAGETLRLRQLRAEGGGGGGLRCHAGRRAGGLQADTAAQAPVPRHPGPPAAPAAPRRGGCPPPGAPLAGGSPQHCQQPRGSRTPGSGVPGSQHRAGPCLCLCPCGQRALPPHPTTSGWGSRPPLLCPGGGGGGCPAAPHPRPSPALGPGLACPGGARGSGRGWGLGGCRGAVPPGGAGGGAGGAAEGGFGGGLGAQQPPPPVKPSAAPPGEAQRRFQSDVTASCGDVTAGRSHEARGVDTPPPPRPGQTPPHAPR